MSKRIMSAALGACVALALATSAEARLDNGPASSYNGQNGHSSARPAPAKKKTSALKGRSVTRAARAGGGTSRSCLQPQARALLDRIESKFGPVQIVSTCRPGAVIARSGKPSKHRYGLAIDFNAGSRKNAIVKWLIANHHSGGTMTYARMNHIHVDIGPRFVSLASRG